MAQLIWVETCQFLNAPPGRLRSLAGFAFAYGMLTFLFGAFLLDLMLIREDKVGEDERTPRSSPRLLSRMEAPIYRA